MAGLISTAGFMSQSTDGLILGTKTLLTDPWKMTMRENKISPLPWNQALFDSFQGRKLRIGWFETDGQIENTPGVTRCVQTAIKLLESDGHELIKFIPDYFCKFRHLAYEFMNAAGGKNSLDFITGDVVDPVIGLILLYFFNGAALINED